MSENIKIVQNYENMIEELELKLGEVESKTLNNAVEIDDIKDALKNSHNENKKILVDNIYHLQADIYDNVSTINQLKQEVHDIWKKVDEHTVQIEDLSKNINVFKALAVIFTLGYFAKCILAALL